MVRAASSFPVPLSPVIRTHIGLSAIFSINLTTSRIFGLRPIIPLTKGLIWATSLFSSLEFIMEFIVSESRYQRKTPYSSVKKLYTSVKKFFAFGLTLQPEKICQKLIKTLFYQYLRVHPYLSENLAHHLPFYYKQDR